ncbi:hypothetical protein GCM10023170_093850 [Phytohabitans houttuyneae]|uniref:Deoxyribonuclease NucA/NucB domain-containing protein n=2 Tax=Phytohabitans houttuyneae TaxID=1076126 RepID=A0A6V8KIP2_9ACTN|nr:hypothetical protein Phou_078840 [Phytohabitans houttuyneae]
MVLYDRESNVDRRGWLRYARMCVVLLLTATGAVALGGSAAAAPAAVCGESVAAGETVGCLTITGSSTMAAKTGVSAAVPPGCGANSWTLTSRLGACQWFTGVYSVVQVQVPNNILVGEIYFSVVSVVGTRGSAGDYWHQTFEYDPEMAWGYVAPTELVPFGECFQACSYMGTTPVLRGPALASASGTQLFSTSGPLGGTWPARSDFGFYFYHPGTVNQVTNTLWLNYPGHRCDNALPGYQTRPGCVQAGWQPTLSISQARYPNYFNHIASSQTVGTPKVLTRTTDDAIQSLNRTISCGQSTGLPAGYTCDEYPFASTWEGAGMRPGGFTMSVHTKRLDIECHVGWLPKHTQTTNRSWSACMIPAIENSTGGGDLGEFYRVNRVLNRDAFTVALAP